MTANSAVTDTKAHPRSRGENEGRECDERGDEGSSPLTRGKRVDRRSPISCPRLIPAHAGKTAARAAAIKSARAHPRSRGENHIKRSSVSQTAGSSPLTRGKLAIALKVRGSQGLIPAHAGKTCDPAVPALVLKAHPRSRGENAGRATRRHRSGGSSPLTRGKPVDAGLPGGGAGLIPAHAGKTQLR